ncbi:MAG TPA: carbamoyl-phosphate synthase large subunit, partial [Bifidobacterium sp.]|nr:carbamoyl-phosphate synthase large subunit [Bifidobacterium sp.]
DIEPLTVDALHEIIRRERPDAILPTLGGQTALNLAMELDKAGILRRYRVELIGAHADAIARAEDRQLFKNAMRELGLDMPRSGSAHTLDEARAVAQTIGSWPLIVRPGFTLGGTGGGIARNAAEFDAICSRGLEASLNSEVLIEESLIGWKEFEMEVMRDKAGNAVIVCSIENMDPMGVHTGDSITVAPIQTLTDREYQAMRDDSIRVLEKIGIATGGSNVQWAVDPRTGRRIIIEMNPRVSRSSALASKATGFPIAKIAALLAVGYTLDELPNDITRKTPAAFEPALDYVVVKVPRFAFEKFPGADIALGTQMKAVGEVMAIGRTFKQAYLKAVRSLEAPLRYHDASTYDPWFKRELAEISAFKVFLATFAGKELPADVLRQAKVMGFSDKEIAQAARLSEDDVRARRQQAGLHPEFRAVDTCAGEFEAVTPYYYSSYGWEAADAADAVPHGKKKIMVLGGGPNRIGQGIEFDYTCVHAVQELGKDYDTIMVNCNPETVSTDYDMSDRLYFEPLTFEDVLEIYEAERKMGPVKGVIVQLGGQTPLSLAARLKAAGVPILGTTPESIDLAENRELFGEVLKKADMNAPRYGTALSLDEAREAAHAIGYPVLVRPSYVLGGRGMEIVYDDAQLRKYVDRALKEAQADTVVSGRLPSPLLIDKFLQDAVEIDVDALFDGKELYIGGIMEHVEEAGVHSGDAACTLPPSTLSDDQIRRLREGTYAIAKGCGVQGLINVQYAFMANTLYVIEANPRASRTVPFASKATGVALAKAAARIMAGETIQQQRDNGLLLPHGDGGDIHRGQQVAVKESVLPFKRFRTPLGKTVDVLLGPEMRSTGEVMGFDRDFPHAFAKSQLAAYEGGLPTSGNVFISVNDTDKRQLPLFAARLVELGFKIWATEGTASVLRRYGIDSKIVDKISVRMDSDPEDPVTTYHAEGSVGKNVVQLIEEGAIDLILNTPNSRGSRSDGYAIRSAAIAADLPQFTTMTEFSAVLMAIEAVRNNDYQIMSIQEHSKQLFELESRE